MPDAQAGEAPTLVADEASDPPPYVVIASQLRARSLIPFLGSAASAAGAAVTGRLPLGAELAGALVEVASYPGSPKDSLSKIAQYLEEVPADRDFLLGKIAEIFYDKVPASYQTAFTRFLTQLPASLLPKVIITTNYDTLVERALENRSHMVVCQIRKGADTGQFLCYRSSNAPISESEILSSTQVDEVLDDRRQADPDTVVVFKMHGTARMRTATTGEFIDSMVLTESDYVDFLVSERSMKIPTAVMDALVKANVLFLGYSLGDWNLRVLLRRIRAIQAGKSRRAQPEPRKHWAIMRSSDQVEAKFWDKRNVNLYTLDLGVFLERLARQLDL